MNNSKAIKIGISSCLLGEQVRFDSGHKKNAYITGILSDYFEFTPFCPEVAIGLGIPREPIRLVLADNSIRCRGTVNVALDVTDKLQNIARERRYWLEELCGYIFKKNSPSCGMERVKLFNKGIPSRNGIGIYANQVMKNFPHLPVEEEGRLEDAHIRENFIRRVYIYARWRSMKQAQITHRQLQVFHAQHKYIFMSHNQKKAKELGALLADTTQTDASILSEKYLDSMMKLLKIIATKQNHVNTLHHIQGYLKKHLDADDKMELENMIADYRNGLLPLIVPITLLRHHFRKFPNAYITESYYMKPHPGELMLLNNI
jgi:uncharacterized protein YbgA (DUF1722 family)/uncharacterized protein YbbK (DUF523 family)